VREHGGTILIGVLVDRASSTRRSAKAKAAGVYKGRPASINATRVRAMKAQGLGAVGNREGPKDRQHVVATRYDKTPENFLASVKLASARIWMRFNESMA
jgi:transposase